jgi:hypothetical protein
VRKSKPKTNRGKKVGPLDNCSTPPYAPRMLYPFISDYFIDCMSEEIIIWECAPGEGYLVRALKFDGKYTILAHNKELDFFIEEPDEYYSIMITNPPFSIKFDWLVRAFELDKPFAFLFPWEFASQFEIALYINDLQFLIPSHRINYKMPHKGWDSNAQFPTCWFCRGLNLPEQFNYVDIKRDQKYFIESYRKGQFLYTMNITEAFTRERSYQ